MTKRPRYDSSAANNTFITIWSHLSTRPSAVHVCW
jgi:hypothetical protein